MISRYENEKSLRSVSKGRRGEDKKGNTQQVFESVVGEEENKGGEELDEQVGKTETKGFRKEGVTEGQDIVGGERGEGDLDIVIQQKQYGKVSKMVTAGRAMIIEETRPHLQEVDQNIILQGLSNLGVSKIGGKGKWRRTGTREREKKACNMMSRIRKIWVVPD